MSKEYRVNITIERSLDLIVHADSKEEAESLAKSDWEAQEEELDYGTNVEVQSVDCLDEDDEES